MNNPCKNCLVCVMCQDICDKYIIYLKKILNMYGFSMENNYFINQKDIWKSSMVHRKQKIHWGLTCIGSGDQVGVLVNYDKYGTVAHAYAYGRRKEYYEQPM